MSGVGKGASCESFRDLVEDMALGAIDDPERARLFAHAAGCPACQARLDELALLADRLLLAAPELEPPAGFEGRVLDHLATATGPAVAAAPPRPGAAARGRSRRRSLVAVVAAVALVVGLAGAGFLVGRAATAGDADAAAPTTTAPAGAAGAGVQATRSGPIVRADGSRSGTAMLVDQPRPLVLVTIDSPRPSTNRVSCELVLPDGTATTVGTWGYSDVAGGAWAAGIAPELLDAVQMNVRDATGALVSSAQLR